MTKLAMIRAAQRNGTLHGGLPEGDPFFGAIAGLAGPLLKKIGPKLGGLFGKKSGGAARKAIAGPAAGGLGRRVAVGAGAAVGTGAAFEVGGRLFRTDPRTGKMVPVGRRRRRGISAVELRGFRKVTGLLRRVGMTPKGLRGARRKVC